MRLGFAHRRHGAPWPASSCQCPSACTSRAGSQTFAPTRSVTRRRPPVVLYSSLVGDLGDSKRQADRLGCGEMAACQIGLDGLGRALRKAGSPSGLGKRKGPAEARP